MEPVSVLLLAVVITLFAFALSGVAAHSRDGFGTADRVGLA